MKTLYITDLDGTFLNDDAQVSPASARIVSDLSARGALISVATARTPATVEPLLAGTVTAPQLVVMTGATIWNRDTQTFIDPILLPEADVRVIEDCMERRGFFLFGYVMTASGHLHVYHPREGLSPDERRFVELRRNLKLKTFHIGHPLPREDYGRTALFFGMGSKEEIVGLADELKSRIGCYVSYYKDTYTPDLWLLEVFASGVSKAAGIRRLKEYLGADRVVVFGDNLNDIPMMEAADLAVAVGNALPETKAAADIVIGDNNSDSVARWIERDYM